MSTCTFQQDCWQAQPELRPTAGAVVLRLESMQQQQQQADGMRTWAAVAEER